MSLNLILGLFALAIGLIDLAGYLLLLSGRRVAWFGKLEPMRTMWGRTAGTAMHFTAYVIVPLAAGALFLLHT